MTPEERFNRIPERLTRMGIAIVPTYPQERRALFSDWQNKATTDMSVVRSWMETGYPLGETPHKVTPDHNWICVAKHDGAQCWDIDDYEACLAHGMPPLPDDIFKVKTPSGGIHVPFLAADEDRQMPNTGVEFDGKLVFEWKANNAPWCAPWQKRADGGVYLPVDSKAPLMNGTHLAYKEAVRTWVKNYTPVRQCVPVTEFHGFHPTFDEEEFAERNHCAILQADEVDAAYHLVPEECPLCGRPNKSTVRAAKSKFIFGGRSYGFVCHACGVNSRDDFETKMEELHTDYEPWGTYQDEFIYRDEDEKMLTGFQVEDVGCEAGSPEKNVEMEDSPIVAEERESVPPVTTVDSDLPASTLDYPSKYTYAPTDTGNAERLIRMYGKVIRYIYETGDWMVWDSNLGWQKDASDKLMRMSKKVTAELAEEAGEDQKRWAHAKASASLKGRQAMIKCAATEKGIVTNLSDWDADKWLLNVKNGVIELKTGTFRPRRQSDLCTKQANVTYNPQAKGELWRASLLKYMCGDQGMVDFLSRWLGLCLTGETSPQAFIFNMGEGSNGKDTVSSCFSAVLGNYAADASFETFVDTKFHSEHRNDLAVLSGAVRFVTSCEGSDGHSLDEGVIKRVTGQSPVTVRHIHGKPFTFYPQFKLWFSSNYEPTIKGQDIGIWRRTKRVPWEYQITDEEKVEDFDQLLLTEEGRSGILNWALEGLAVYVQEGKMRYHPKIDEATTTYRQEMNIIGRFMREQYESDTHKYVIGSVFYKHYVQWCKDNGHYAVNSRKFYAEFRKKFPQYTEQDSKHGALFYGLVRKNEEPQIPVEMA